MSHSIREIATALGAVAEGDLDLRIARASEPATAGPDALALAMDPKFADGIAKGQARAALLWQDADWRDGAGGGDFRAARAAGDVRAEPDAGSRPGGCARDSSAMRD